MPMGVPFPTATAKLLRQTVAKLFLPNLLLIVASYRVWPLTDAPTAAAYCGCCRMMLIAKCFCCQFLPIAFADCAHCCLADGAHCCLAESCLMPMGAPFPTATAELLRQTVAKLFLPNLLLIVASYRLWPFLDLCKGT